MSKITRFLDFISDSLAKPVDFFADFISRENLTPFQVILRLFACFLFLPLLVIVGIISVFIATIRTILGGAEK